MSLRMALFAFPLAALSVVAAEIAPAPRPAAKPVAVSPAITLDRKVFAEVKDRSEIMANLRHLCDEIGPRLTGSASLERANRWAADRMKSYGLENVRLEPYEIPLGWERGTAQLRLIEPEVIRPLTVAALGWTPGTNGTVRGPVVVMDAKTKEDLAKFKGKLRDAVVLRGPPTEVKPVTDTTYGPPPVPAVSAKPKDKNAPPAPPSREQLRTFRLEMVEFLKAEGAAALLMDSAKPHGLLVTTGAWRGADRGEPQEPLPALFVAHEHYAMLHRLAARPGSPPRVEIAVTNRFIPGPLTVYNTVGEVRGSEKPDEFVVIGAHLDSWDLASGATDNGTGSCVVLEAARTLATLAKQGQQPKRTVRFVLFTGEEQGLHGSKAFVKKHADEMPKTSAALVHDTGTGRVLGFGLQGREAVRKVLDPELTALKELESWRGVDLTGSGGTDHLSFEAVGVPGFACRQDIDEYRFTHHTQSDTFDKVKAPNLIQGAQAIAATALRIANMPSLLPRDKPAPPKKEEPKKAG